MCAKFMTLHDFLEKLIKYRSVNRQLLAYVEDKYKGLLESLIEQCIKNDIIEETGEELKLRRGVELLIILPFFNVMPDRLSSYIEWREFEEYISRVFTELGWDVYVGYTHTRIDKFQIDVIALNASLKLSIFVECKHWKRSSKVYANVETLVNIHMKRIEKYLRNCEWVCMKLPKLRNVEKIVPVIIVLHDIPVKILNGVPIVSVHRIVDFIVNIDSYIDALNIVAFKNRCYAEA